MPFDEGKSGTKESVRAIKKEFDMLSLQLKDGEYMTIGDDVVIQLNRISGNRCKLTINAPREIPILRGNVLERNGGQRPECVFDAVGRNGRKNKPTSFQTADEPVEI